MADIKALRFVVPMTHSAQDALWRKRLARIDEECKNTDCFLDTPWEGIRSFENLAFRILCVPDEYSFYQHLRKWIAALGFEIISDSHPDIVATMAPGAMYTVHLGTAGHAP
jgi:hypothetical protein